jgi:hypothetical protein
MSVTVPVSLNFLMKCHSVAIWHVTLKIHCHKLLFELYCIFFSKMKHMFRQKHTGVSLQCKFNKTCVHPICHSLPEWHG